ncbi:uncharacterized protein [Linepithema humile]|uniref:uncharacterized protein isoform X4 n=1 Tax=Linepithema humile TaxID=83485 RepID=UPI00351EF1F8
MFSRAAKSVVKSLGSRQIQIGEKNFQPSWIITANRPCSTKISHPNATINNARTHNNIAHNLSNLQGDNGKNQTDQLVEALYRLPIAEEASTLNSLLIPNEIIPKLQSKEKILTGRLLASGLFGERRRKSSLSMRSAVDLFESGKSIELGKIRANRDPLSIISSHQQIMGIDFINDFQQDLNSTVDRHFSSPHEHFDSNFRRCDDRQFDESKPLYDKQLHDDYFPQGDEYEEEIGTGDHQLGKKSKKPPRSDDEYDNFKPIILMFENDKCVSGGPLTKLITHVHFPNTGLIETVQTILMSKRISDQEAVEKLQILIDKVTEFKRRAFRDKSNAAKSRGQSDERKEKKIGKKNNGAETTNRSGLTNQKQDYSFV